MSNPCNFSRPGRNYGVHLPLNHITFKSKLKWEQSRWKEWKYEVLLQIRPKSGGMCHLNPPAHRFRWHLEKNIKQGSEKLISEYLRC